MTDSIKREAVNLVESNADYLTEVIEAAIVNLLADAKLDGDNALVAELVKIYLTEATKNDLSR